MRVNPVAPVHPSKKVTIRSSQFSRELLERAYREIEAAKQSQQKKPG
jgi:hypothetical protein